MKKVRTVVIDGVEIQTSLSAVEIASLNKINAEQSKEIKKLSNIINAIEKDIENERMSHWAPGPLYLTELMEKIKKLKGGIK